MNFEKMGPNIGLLFNAVCTSSKLDVLAPEILDDIRVILFTRC